MSSSTRFRRLITALRICKFVNLGWQCQMSQMISRGGCNLRAAAADGSVRAMRDSPSHRRSREKSTARGHSIATLLLHAWF